jgi:hypothetical protein
VLSNELMNIYNIEMDPREQILHYRGQRLGLQAVPVPPRRPTI